MAVLLLYGKKNCTCETGLGRKSRSQKSTVAFARRRHRKVETTSLHRDVQLAVDAKLQPFDGPTIAKQEKVESVVLIVKMPPSSP